MAKTYLLRPMPHMIDRYDLFLSQSLTALGWPEYGDVTGKTKTQIKELFFQKMPQIWQNKGKGTPSKFQMAAAAAQVNMFVNIIDIGDYILCPHDDEVAIGKISSDFMYVASLDIDSPQGGYQYQRKVDWLKTVQRNELPDSVKAYLRNPRTVGNINVDESLIANLITGSNGNNGASVTSVPIALRKDLTINIEIPDDLTEREAELICQTIKLRVAD